MSQLCIWGTSVKKVGDEAQLAAILTYFHKLYPSLEYCVFSRLVDEVERLMALLGTQGQCMPLIRFTAVTRALRRSRGLVIIGGPFFEDPKQMASLACLVTVAQALGKPVITFATTLFGIRKHTSRRFYRWLYTRLDLISARDPSAQQVLDELSVDKKIYPLPDPRYLLEPVPASRVGEILRQAGMEPTQPFVIMTTRYLHDDMPDWVKAQNHYASDTAQRAYAEMSAFLATINQDYQILILPMHPQMSEDEAVARLLLAKCTGRAALLNERLSAVEVMGLLRDSCCSIQSRVGSTVFSVVAGSPFLALSFESRMRDFMHSQALDAYCFDWHQAHREVLLEGFAALLKRREAITSDFQQLREDQRAAFHQAARTVTALLQLDPPDRQK